MTGITCARHADRPAIAYCAGCGKPLCGTCVVRLSTGNYCEECAETPDHRPRKARGRGVRPRLLVGITLLLVAAYLVSRLL